MTELSAAQIEERRQAARDRWAKRGVIASAFVAAGAVVGRKIGGRIGAEFARRHKLSADRLNPVAARRLMVLIERRKARVEAARVIREKSIKRPFTKPIVEENPASPSFAARYVRSLRSQNARAPADIASINDALTRNEETWELPEQTANMMRRQVNAHATEMSMRNAKIARLMSALPKQRKMRAGSTVTRQTEEWERTTKIKGARGSKSYRAERLKNALSGSDNAQKTTVQEFLADPKNRQAIEGLDEGEQQDVLHQWIQDRAAAEARPQKIVTKTTVKVHSQKGKTHQRQAHRAVVRPSDISSSEADQMRTDLRNEANDIRDKAHIYINRTARRDWPKAQRQVSERYAARVLHAVSGMGRQRGLLVGAAAGLLAGAFAARALDHQSNPVQSVEKYSQAIPALNKAADQPDPDQPDLFEHAAKRKLKAVDAVTGKLAHGVAGAFASWKDAATDDALGNADAPGGLLDRLDEALGRGMEPLDDATKAGLQTPTHIVTDPASPDAGDGKSHIIRFGFDLRGPGEEAFIKRYRFGRVREISDEQRRNIRGIMLAAAQRGDAPQTTARRIRDVIGLTAYQAGIVANYRAQLATLDPRALGYELRDHRFDKTVKRAIDDGKALSEAQIDKMVDAYSRRFLAYRAMTIARTESLRAANNAHIEQIRKMLATNPDYTCVKTWMATIDDRTRPDHRILNRQTVIGIDTPFKCESGEEIRWPHDPKAAAKEVIRCRCILMTSIVPRSNVAASGLRSFAEPYADFWSGPKERSREFQSAGA